MTASLTELADRVQALTCACRLADEDIARAVGYTAWGGRRMFSATPDYGFTYRDPLGNYVGAPPYFTASLDAVMTLARNNREAMLMIHAAFGSFESDEMDAAPNIFPRIKAMLLTNLRARAAAESSHG